MSLWSGGLNESFTTLGGEHLHEVDEHEVDEVVRCGVSGGCLLRKLGAYALPPPLSPVQPPFDLLPWTSSCF